jgi:hypothetical protein
VADFVVRLFRTVFMLALGALVMALVVCLLLATLAWLLGSWLWGALTGRRITAREQWGRFQHSAATVVWQRYRQTAAGPGRTAERADTVEVEDVVFRDVSAPPPGQDRLGH